MRLAALIFLAAVFGPGMARASAVIPFTGTIDLKARQVDVLIGSASGGRSLSVSVLKSGRESYLLKIQALHAPLGLGDVVGTMNGEFRITGQDRMSRELYGELKSQDILLDQKPVPDVRFKFAVRDGYVMVDPLWSGGLAVRGSVELKGKRRVDMTCDVVSADIETVAGCIQRFFPQAGKSWSDVSGILKGSLHFSGAWPRPGIKGRVEVYSGRLKGFDYESILLDVDGGYPLLEVKMASVTGPEGLAFRLAGTLDLSDTGSLMEQVRHFRRITVVETSANRRSWTLKSTETDRNSKTEMKYLFLKDDRGDAEAVLGVQKSIGF